jgi:GTP-binding nuclear protein Ran
MLSKLLSYISTSTSTSITIEEKQTTSIPQASKQYKVVITGDGGVGKTSFVNKLGNDNFYRTYIPTMGVNVVSLQVKIKTCDGFKTCILNMWDTAGQEKFGGLRDAYYRGCDACLILFSADDKTSFKNVGPWYREISRVCENIPIILAGTKIDLLLKSNIVNSNKVSSYAKTKKNLYFSCFFSSKTSENLLQPIELLLSKLENDPDLKILEIKVI